MDKAILKMVAAVVAALEDNEARTATKFMSAGEKVKDGLVVRASRRVYQGKRRPTQPLEISLKVGRPQYSERAFIKKCLAAGEPFPVKKIKLGFGTGNRHGR